MSTTQTAKPASPAARASRFSFSSLAPYSALAGMVLVVLGIGLARPIYLSPQNLGTVLVDATVLAVLAVGLSIVMSMRGIDLSIAATADLAGYVTAMLLLSGSGLAPALLAGLAIGVVVGCVNGALAGYLGVPAIVATLGTNLLLVAAALVVSNNGTPQQLFTGQPQLVGDFLGLGTGGIGPLRFLVLITIVVILVTWFATRRTVWGRQIDLVEAGARAAYLSGVPVRLTFASGFVAAAVLAAIAGILLTARTGVVVPGTAQPLLLDAFTAVYLGSIASIRGRISVLWTVVGAVFVALLANGLTLLGLGAPWRFGLNGLLILLALALGTLRRRATAAR